MDLEKELGDEEVITSGFKFCDINLYICNFALCTKHATKLYLILTNDRPYFSVRCDEHNCVNFNGKTFLVNDEIFNYVKKHNQKIEASRKIESAIRQLINSGHCEADIIKLCKKAYADLVIKDVIE